MDSMDEMLFGEGGLAGLINDQLKETVKDKARETAEKGAEMASNIAKGSATNPLGPLGAVIVEVLVMIMEKLKIVQMVIGFAMNIIENIADLINVALEPLEPLFDSFFSLIDSVFGFLKPVFKLIAKVLVFLQPVLKLFTDLFDWIGQLLGQILGLFGAEMEKSATQQKGDREESKQILEDLVDVLQDVNDIVKNIEETVRNLRYSDLNLMSAYEKLAMAERDYQKLLIEAQTGGKEEISALTGFVQEYLSIAQGVEKSSKAYEVRYAGVIEDLEALGEVTLDSGKSAFQTAKEKLDELGEVSIEFGESLGSAVKNVQDLSLIHI